MKLRLMAAACGLLPFAAHADDLGLWTQSYLAGGGGARGAALSAGIGNKVDALEFNAINLGRVSGTSTAKFMGFSLVQTATPVNDFSFLFRVGIGRAITNFDGGATATRVGLGGGIYFGIGEQYQPTKHFAVRAELYRIGYAASPGATQSGAAYPFTLSAMLIF